MPKPMRYDTQAIICLCPTLLGSAKATQAKRRMAGEQSKSVLYTTGPLINLPGEYRRPNSRLIIIGHGNPSSTLIFGQGAGGTEFRWTPAQLARMVQHWLNGSVIKTISIRSCYGGGDRGGKHRSSGEDLGMYLGRMTVDPRKSFAYEFASRCGFAEKVTARTGVVTTEFSYEDDYDPTAEDFESRVVDVTQKVSNSRRGKAYKALFSPDRNARPDNPKPPSMAMFNV